MYKPTPHSRKIIGVNYSACVEQLRDGELLVVEYEDIAADRTCLVPIAHSAQWEFVYSLDGSDIYGFWAIDQTDWDASRSRFIPDDENEPLFSTVSRPVESLVFYLLGFEDEAAVDTYLSLRFGPRTALWDLGPETLEPRGFFRALESDPLDHIIESLKEA